MASAHLKLCHAPRGDPDGAYSAFANFINGINDPNVRLRPEELIRAAIAEQNLFFLQDESGQLIGTTGFYRHGPEDNIWGEIGSSLVDIRHRGMKLQTLMYKYIISLEWLAYRPLGPVVALVDHSAKGSYLNIESCKFFRCTVVPHRLKQAKREQDWSKVDTQEKRLYLLTKEAIRDSLIFVSEHGVCCDTASRDGRRNCSVSVELEFLKEPDLAEELRLEAEYVLSSNYGEAEN